MIEVVTLGEMIIDFMALESGVSLVEAPGFLKAPGGAPANVAVGLCKLGIPAGFIGKFGEDAFGRFLVETLKENGVDISNVIFEPRARTGLAFVSLTKEGERDFMFYRHPCADMLLSPEEIDEQYIKKAKIFHHGSISLVSEPSKSATLKAIEISKENQLLISYDPNLRLSLWDTSEHAKSEIIGALQFADILKVSEVEVEFITGKPDIPQGCLELLNFGPRLVVATLGRDGCYFHAGEFCGPVEGFKVNSVDTTGAGDGFVAGMLAGILERIKEDGKLEQLDKPAIEEVLRFANAVGALTTTKKGAIPGLPTKKEVIEFLKSHRR